MRIKVTLSTVLLALMLLLGLGIDSVIGVPDLKIQAGAGRAPSISWSPDMEISSLRVYAGLYEPGEPFDGDQVMWWVKATEGQALHSPISYGIELPGARTIQQPRHLVAGHTYTVYLNQADQSFSGDRNIYEATEIFTAIIPSLPDHIVN